MSELGHLDGVAGLKKYEMKLSSVIFIIYCIVAAGAFGVEEMISASGPGITIAILLIFPVIWALPLSMSVAEMGSVLPSEGGSYVWVTEALGEFWGYLAGWWGTLSYYMTIGIYIVLSVGYLGYYVEMTELQAYIVKVGLILVFTIINLLGVKEVGRASTIFSMVVLLAFAVVAVVGFMNWHNNPMTPFIAEGQSLKESVGSCIGLCIWMYCGYTSISNLAGEVKNPQIIPKGILLSMPVVALSYVLPTMAGLASVGNWSNWSTAGEGAVGFSTVLTQFLGPAFGISFLAIAIISQSSMFNTSLATGSRGFFVLADNNLAPKFFRKVSKKRGVPYVGILSLAIVAMIMVQFEFTTLVLAEVVFDIALYIMISIALMVLRKKIPVSERKGLFVIPGGKSGLCLCGGLPIVISVIALMINGTDYFVAGLLMTATGPVSYIIFKIAYGGFFKNNPERYPINPRTKLAEGDLFRISLYTFLTGIFAFFGSYILSWYEAGWGPAYYVEEYGTGFFSNFGRMLESLRLVGMGAVVISIILFALAYMVEKRSEKEVLS